VLKLETWQQDKKIFWYEQMTSAGDGWVSSRLTYSLDEMAQSVGAGWKDLLEELSVKLFRLGWDGGLSQVKEKFGTLCFYWRCNILDPVNQEIAFDVVRQAERQSGQICERCGAPGHTRGRGWIYTSCEEHAKEGDKPLEDI
jgi:hypothetical protein